MFLPEWILTLGFKQVPIQKSILLFEGLLFIGWNFLFNVMSDVFNVLFPTFKYDRDMGSTLSKIKNFQEKKSIIGESRINWDKILRKNLDKRIT